MFERSDKKDRRLSAFISFSFLLVAINRVATLPFAASYQQIIAIGQWGIYLYLFISNLKYILSKSRSILIKSYLLFILLYLWSCLYSALRGQPIGLVVSHEVVWTLFFFLPVGLSTYSIDNYKLLYKSLYKVSYVISLLCIFYSVYRLYINPFGGSYDMAFGYILLVPTLLHCSEFKNNHSIGILLYIVIELLFLLLFGSRGVVIAILAYLFLGMYLKQKSLMGKAKLLVPLLILSLVYIQLPNINEFLENHNIYSRTLIKLASGDDGDETHGRTNHWDVGMDLVYKKPILGYGLGGYYYDFHNAISVKYPDELYAFDIESGAWVKSGVSVSGAHSGFIDMMLYFGVLVGFPLALWLLLSFFKLNKVDDRYLFELALIFYSSYIIGNMIVGSGIFTKPGCAIFLFLLLRMKKYPHIMKQIQE